MNYTKCSALNVDFNGVRFDPQGSTSPYEGIKFGYPIENVRCLLLSTNLARLSAIVFTLDEPIVVKLRFLSFMPSFEGKLLTQRHQIISLETRYSRLSYGENPESLSDLCLFRYRVVTPQTHRQIDRQTERIPIANTRSQQYLRYRTNGTNVSQQFVNDKNSKIGQNFGAFWLITLGPLDRRETFKHNWKCVNLDNVCTKIGGIPPPPPQKKWGELFFYI